MHVKMENKSSRGALSLPTLFFEVFLFLHLYMPKNSLYIKMYRILFWVSACQEDYSFPEGFHAILSLEISQYIFVSETQFHVRQLYRSESSNDWVRSFFFHFYFTDILTVITVDAKEHG